MRTVPALLTAALTVAAAAVSPASADPVDTPTRTPGVDEIFTGYTLSTFVDGQVASLDEIIDPLSPVSDAFYTEPELTGDESAGTLLKAEPVQVQFTGVQPGNLRAWRTMFVTEEMDGTPSVSTGILMVPDDGKEDATRAIIGYQEANDSVGARCHPSTQWTGGDPLDGASWSALGPLALMFDRGYAVMISDVGNDAQESPHGVFAGKYAANTLLDGVRSAMKVETAGLSAEAPVGLFGIAGGGVGAGFAAERAASYAPELDIRGTVLEGMVVDQRNFFRGADGSLGSGFVFATLLGLEPKYPEMDLNSHLTPLGRQIADWYRGQCQTPAYFTMPFVPLSALFVEGIPPADIPEFQHVYDDNLLGASGAAPDAPVLISSCVADDSPMSLVPAADARGLADRYRAGGTSVSYQPTDCSMTNFVTNLYGWGTDLFGMQTISWLEKQLE
ncbi:lipase family protein [Corynebacterium terpenotabidum]|uniref:Putative lipase n=1 Tax=Corynebacterium terpenotabidum Y-11 TaxID=1200352 RepID=S4XFK9_9CORY|nr:lipase family protein [Corynebacterium terpenotabidum]AGP30415.1 putative lipase [Corynebacterium terpenotabidum Y-11]